MQKALWDLTWGICLFKIPVQGFHVLIYHSIDKALKGEPTSISVVERFKKNKQTKTFLTLCK